MEAVKVIPLSNGRIIMDVQRRWLFGLWTTTTQYVGEDKYTHIESFQTWKYLNTGREVAYPYYGPWSTDLNYLYRVYKIKQELLEKEESS